MTPDELPAALVDAAARLAAAGIRTELVAEWTVPRTLGIPRAPRLAILGRAWRLGPLLLVTDGTLRATGTAIRVGEPAHSALRSKLAEDRLALQVAARRSRIPDGETVDVDTRPIPDPSTSPLEIRAGQVRIRWAASADPRPLDDYLAERIDLLLHPPEGAGESPR